MNVHLHVCVIDGVFEQAAGGTDADLASSPASVIFHPASALDETVVAQVQTDLRRRILRAYCPPGAPGHGRRCGFCVLAGLWQRVLAPTVWGSGLRRQFIRSDKLGRQDI